MIDAIRARVLARGITRLCHFTPSRNLVHILTDQRGLLSTLRLAADERAVFNPTDLQRLDGHPEHACCSIQYPNAWYFRQARGRDRIFRDWVVLLLDRRYLWQPGTKFCSRNAAAGGGCYVGEGLEAFESMFAPRVIGAGGRVFVRQPNRADNVTTDEQAEVLILDGIAPRDLLAIVVSDPSQARREQARLHLLGATVPPILVAPDLFDADRLTSLLRAGAVPREDLFEPGEDAHAG